MWLFLHIVIAKIFFVNVSLTTFHLQKENSTFSAISLYCYRTAGKREDGGEVSAGNARMGRGSKRSERGTGNQERAEREREEKRRRKEGEIERRRTWVFHQICFACFLLPHTFGGRLDSFSH